jgi:hydrogenase expression/formation protein HypC
MCLAVPTQVKAVAGVTAEVEAGGVSRKISIALTPDVRSGDFILIHAGYAISVLDEAEARETLRLIAEFNEDRG